MIAENLIRAETRLLHQLMRSSSFRMSPVFIALFTLFASTFRTRTALQAEIAYATRSLCFNSARRGVCASSNLTGSSGFCGLGYGRSGGAGSVS